MLKRAYSLLHVKAVDGERRLITGIATTPEPDRMGDIVEPLGVQFKNPLPLLLYHDSKKPVGHATFGKVTKDGIPFEASLPQIDDPGTVKDRIDEAWTSIKSGLITGVSIGFRSLEEVFMKETSSFRFLKTEVLELSLVAIPANAGATIQTIKSLDVGLAATGTEDSREITAPGATGTSRVVSLITKGRSMKKTYAEQITDWKNTRQQKSARMDEIMEKSAESGQTLDAQLKEEHDTLDREVSDIDDHIKRLEASEVRAKSVAVPAAGSTAAAAAASRGGNHVITVKQNAPAGIRFARYAMCVALAKGSRLEALELAKQAYPDDLEIQTHIKAAVGAATTANGQGPLLQYSDFLGDFVDFLRPGSIIGKFGTNGIPALRRVPFNSRVSTQTAGGSGYWVGQGLPKPLTKGTFSTITLDFHKLATISVLTQEEVKFASPSAEAKVRDDLAAAIIARMDQDFVDPANAGTANVKPASITNGVAATAVSGATASALRVDFKNLMAPFIAANINPASAVLIMSSGMALNLSLMQNALSQDEHPNITMQGGNLFGIPVIVSEYLTALGSPSTGMIIIVNASDIYLADDGGVSIEASGEASLEMLDGSLVQSGAAGTGASLVSLWQNNLLGLKAERFITWKKRRAEAVQYLSPAAYTPA